MKTEDKNKLGRLIDGPAHRDAVHIAVAPCMAGEDLDPGTRVALSAGAAVSASEPTIGIVDPFLKDPVLKGERFWVILDPGTAMNLRHEWDHPAFTTGKATAADWLKQYAEQHRLTFEQLMEGVEKFIQLGCDDATLDDNFDTFEVPDEFWTHYQAVTGRVGKGNFWGCCI